MFNFQRWEVRKFLRWFHERVRWGVNEKWGSKMTPVRREPPGQVNAPVSSAGATPLSQKKRKGKKIKGKLLKKPREPWANTPRPAGKSAAVHSVAQVRGNSSNAPVGGVEGFRREEDFFGLLPIDEFIPSNFDMECFKAVILFGFLRPARRYKPVNGSYMTRQDIIKRVDNKGYPVEEVKRVLWWLESKRVAVSPHDGSFGAIMLSLNTKPSSVEDTEAQRICQVCADALAKLRAVN